MASQKNGTIYIGVTRNLVKRVYEHRHDLVESFTKKYAVHSLIYYEILNSMEQAIIREKQIKKWHRAWKLDLFERGNPEWDELYDQVVG